MPSKSEMLFTAEILEAHAGWPEKEMQVKAADLRQRAAGEVSLPTFKSIKQILWGVLVGFTITASLLLPRWQPGLSDEDLRALIAQRDQLAAALDKQTQTLAACTNKLESFVDGSTILYENDPVTSGEAAVAFIAGALGAPAAPGGQPLPRWVIPGRVQPILIGPSRGEVYFHVRGGKDLSAQEGPFTPARPYGAHGQIPQGGRP